MIGNNSEVKKINDVFDITKQCYFFIKVKNETGKFKSRIKEDKTIINNNSLLILKKEIEDIKKNVEDEIEGKQINILSNYYNSLLNLKEINKEKSCYAQNIKEIIDNYRGEKCITLKHIQQEYLLRYHKRLSLMTISRILRRHLKIHFR